MDNKQLSGVQSMKTWIDNVLIQNFVFNYLYEKSRPAIGHPVLYVTKNTMYTIGFELLIDKFRGIVKFVL